MLDDFAFFLEQERGRQLATVQAALDDAVRAGDAAAIATLRPQWLKLKSLSTTAADRPAAGVSDAEALAVAQALVGNMMEVAADAVVKV